MKLVHTLLFMLRENMLPQDIALADRCLKSLEKSTYTTIIIYNQGCWPNERLKAYLKKFQLDCIVIGDGVNAGIPAGHHACYEHAFTIPGVSYITELHMDMAFAGHWEDALVDYLDTHENEPMIGCGTVTKIGELIFLGTKVPLPPTDLDAMDAYLDGLKQDVVVEGLTNPCLHRRDVLKEIDALDPRFLPGKQGFDDDCLMLSYYYYLGTHANWRPKVNYNSVVCHDTCGQRFSIDEDVMINYHGLVRKHGAMGLKVLAGLQKNSWPIEFFTSKFNELADTSSV